jgi:MFS family permease
MKQFMPFLSKIKNFFLWPKRELSWWISNWKESKEFRRQLLAVVLGFGVGGILWGWQCYNWVTTHNEVFTNPFSFVLGAIYLAIFGGLGLGWAFFRKDKKKFLLLILLGIPIWVVAFLVGQILSVFMLFSIDVDPAQVFYITIPFLFLEVITNLFISLFQFFIVSPFMLIHYFVPSFKIPELLFNFNDLLNLQPQLLIFGAWLGFICVASLMSLFYFYFFSVKNKKSFIYLVSLTVFLFSLISPIFANLIAFYLCHSLFLAYLFTFFLITTIFSLVLFKAVKHESKS